MTSSGVPNKDRAESALSVYRSAMQKYISLVLQREYGSDWLFEQVLTEEVRRRSQRNYQQRLQSLRSGTPPQDLIDLSDIPHLIQGNRDSFDDLRRADIDRMHWIRDLRNELHHAAHADDCSPSYADAVVGLCGLVLEQCGLVDAVESVRRLSSIEPAGRTGTTAKALAEERQGRRGERHQDLAAREHDVRDKYLADRALLIYRSAMRQHMRSVLQREYGETWFRQAYQDDAQGRNRSRHERQLRELDHGAAPEQLIDITDFPVLVLNNQQLFPELERADINGMIAIVQLRSLFVHSHDRTPDQVDMIVDLCGRVLERCGLANEAEIVRRLSLPAFDDIVELRRWFDADEARRQRHWSEYTVLERLEKKQHRSPSGAASSQSHTDDAPPERSRSLFSRIFRR